LSVGGTELAGHSDIKSTVFPTVIKEIDGKVSQSGSSGDAWNGLQGRYSLQRGVYKIV